MNFKRIKKKQVIIGITVIMILACGIGTGLHFYNEYQEEKALEEARRHPYFTKDHLTVSEMHTLRLFYLMDTDPYYVDEALEKEGPDFSYIEIIPSENTEKIVALVNYYLFDQFYSADIKGKEYAGKCGLSYGNRMTVDWLMNHLKDSIQILEKSPVLKGILELDEKWIRYELISEDVRYTSYYLSRVELLSLSSWFSIETVQDLLDLDIQFEQEGRKDFADVTLKATEYTEKAAAAMNWLLFEEAAPENAAGIEKAEEYGLSKENPVTAKWMITHPKETIEIKNAMENYGDIFYYGDKIEEIYNEIRSQ